MCCTCSCPPPICSTGITSAELRHRRSRRRSRMSPPLPGNPGVVVSAGLTLGVERYRYPKDLPKVAAKGGAVLQGTGPARRSARVPSRRSSSPTSARTRIKYGNQGILLNSDGLKNGCSGRSTDRRATPHRSECRDDTRSTGTLIKFGIFAVVMAMLTAFLFFIFGQMRTGSTNGLFCGLHRCVAARKRATPCGSRASGWAPSRRCRCSRTARCW